MSMIDVTKKLKSTIIQCPFCGTDGKLYQSEANPVNGKYVCCCSDTKCIGHKTHPKFIKATDAVNQWNTRFKANDVITTFWRVELAENGWIDYICQNCGFTENVDNGVLLMWRYCPNCGATAQDKAYYPEDYN